MSLYIWCWIKLNVPNSGKCIIVYYNCLSGPQTSKSLDGETNTPSVSGNEGLGLDPRLEGIGHGHSFQLKVS